jgi:hypothetical protein
MTTDKEKIYSHESYGMIGFHRICGGGGQNLFGSQLKDHPSRIMLTIHTCERRHSLGRDWYHAEKKIIEIDMSNIQFADLITNMNIGDGVPCTLRMINGKRLESPPAVENEAEAVRINFGNDLEKLKGDLIGLQNKAKQILGQSGTINKASKEELLSLVSTICQEVTSNLPFVLESFQEAVEKTTSVAKSEIVAFASNIATMTGVQQLKEIGADTNTKLIEKQ